MTLYKESWAGKKAEKGQQTSGLEPTTFKLVRFGWHSTFCAAQQCTAPNTEV